MKRSSALLAKMRRQRGGHVAAPFEYLDAVDREFLKAYNEVAVLNFSYGDAGRTRVLDARTKELIAVALLVTVRGDTTQQHMRKALEHGASLREVVEALEMAMQVCGAPALEFGLRKLMDLEPAK